VLVLSALDFGLTEPNTNNPRGNLGLLALAQRKAYVAQTSVADAEHLGNSMLQALAHEGPALVQVYAPSPERHGFAPRETLTQARLAVECRALPLFRYDPHAEGVFGSRIALDGNPEDGENAITFADWARGQNRFAAHFDTPPADEDSEQPCTVSPELTAAADECLANWQTLQELAGTVTPFTERLEQEIRADLAAKHEADLESQKKAFEAEIQKVQEKTQAEIASKIRSRLLQMAAQKRD
jgi:pyruvate-ferredoxin/flavodoxin oxidoreductase